MTAFRDASVVVLETTPTAVRAVLGLNEILRLPSVDIQARVGLRKTDSHVNGVGTSQAKVSEPSANINDYLVGTSLDEALNAGEDIEVYWPFIDAEISNWTQAEALWKYVLFKALQLRRVTNESPVLLSIMSSLSRGMYERLCQLFFERFNVPGFTVIERPLSQLYATNNSSGIVVDIGRDTTDVVPIFDTAIQHMARMSIPLGLRHCEMYLAHLLRSNQTVMAAFSSLSEEELQKTLLELSRQIWSAGLISVPSEGDILPNPEEEGVTNIAAILVAGKEKSIIESGLKKKANAKATEAERERARQAEALDLTSFQFRDHSLTLGRERHRFCEPLLNPEVLQHVPVMDAILSEALSVPDAINDAIRMTEIDKRNVVWEALFVTGDCASQVRGVGTAIRARLPDHPPVNPEALAISEATARSPRTLKVPDYFAEYREKGESYAGFLGASIVAKVCFGDANGRNYVSKPDYSFRGPSCILELCPTVL